MGPYDFVSSAPASFQGTLSLSPGEFALGLPIPVPSTCIWLPCGLQIGTMGVILAQPIGQAVGAQSKKANQKSPPGYGNCS